MVELVASAVQPGLRLGLKRALLRVRLAVAASKPMRGAYLSQRFAYLAPHIHQADPSIAADIAAGQVVLGGRSLLCGNRSPFQLDPPSESFAQALYGFGWLAHCEASESASVRAHARSLVRDFLNQQEKAPPAFADLPGVMARRVIAWVTHSALLTEGQDILWYNGLLSQLARDGARLAVYARRTDIGMGRLEAALGLMFHALSLDCGKKAIPRAERMLDLALASLTAPDGATHDRDCGTVALMAADLVAMLSLYRIRQMQPPPGFSSSLADMIAFLRLVQHPDGGLMLMNGGGRVPRDLAAEVVRSRRGQASLLTSAVETGFERVENNHAVLIADAGTPVRRSCSGRAGASALAFEFSTRADRIIVSCGMPPGADREIARLYRSAAAHSTILMEGEGLAGLRDAPVVNGEIETRLDPLRGSLAPLRARGENGETLTLGHRGFLETHGYVLERQLTLADVLPGVMCRDRFIDQAAGGQKRLVTLTFHLNPRIRPVRISRPDAIVLRLPDEKPGYDQFLFEAPGLALVLEESRVFEAGSPQNRSHCIVVEAEITGTSEIIWRILPYLPELS
ncbi:MAG: heparinase II/III domain-containing protein [Rhabdaerophilum sp.]